MDGTLQWKKKMCLLYFIACFKKKTYVNIPTSSIILTTLAKPISREHFSLQQSANWLLKQHSVDFSLFGLLLLQQL